MLVLIALSILCISHVEESDKHAGFFFNEKLKRDDLVFTIFSSYAQCFVHFVGVVRSNLRKQLHQAAHLCRCPLTADFSALEDVLARLPRR